MTSFRVCASTLAAVHPWQLRQQGAAGGRLCLRSPSSHSTRPGSGPWELRWVCKGGGVREGGGPGHVHAKCMYVYGAGLCVLYGRAELLAQEVGMLIVHSH
jgi:hypothetical protein